MTPTDYELVSREFQVLLSVFIVCVIDIRASYYVEAMKYFIELEKFPYKYALVVGYLIYIYTRFVSSNDEIWMSNNL